MKKFRVELSWTEHWTRVIEVRAKDMAEAESKAINEEGKEVFRDSDSIDVSEPTITNIEQISSRICKSHGRKFEIEGICEKCEDMKEDCEREWNIKNVVVE